MPDISIILPVFNAAPYLPRCLNALRGQTFADIEILCVDDGSTDGSGAILERFAAGDARFRIFRQGNAGAAAARNTALKHVRGRFLMFCDADDWYEPDFCRLMREAIAAHDVDFAMADCSFAFENGYTRPQEALDELKARFPDGEHELDAKSRQEINVVLWNKIFLTQKVRDFGISFPEGWHGEDNAFIYHYLCVSDRFFALNQKLYTYTIRHGSLMGAYYAGLDKHIKDAFFALEWAEQGLKRKHCFSSASRSFLLDTLWGLILWCLPTLETEEERQELVRRASHALKELRENGEIPERLRFLLENERDAIKKIAGLQAQRHPQEEPAFQQDANSVKSFDAACAKI